MIILFACALGAAKGYIDARYEVDKLLDAQLAQSAHALLELSSHELYEQMAFNASKKQPKKGYKPQIHPYEQNVVFQIWSIGGNLAVRSPSAPEIPMVEVENEFVERMIGSDRWRVFAISDKDSHVQVQVGERYDQREALSNEVAARLLTPLFVALPMIVIMIWIWIGSAMRPLNKVAHDIHQREPENLQPVSTEGVPQEAKPMVDALNALLERVRVAYDNIRLFTSNAAHELRTPLAALKIHTQLAERAGNEEERLEAMQRVERGVDRATSLVEQLLTLTRLEPEAAQGEKKDVHLHLLTEDIVAELAPAAIKKHIEVNLAENDCCLVHVNAGMMGILIRNLVENAIRYTPPAGKVDISLYQIDQAIRLRVADSGPGIPEAERSKVFGRFYRGSELDDANKENGTGLGLAIVQRICELLHAQIELGESRYHGLQVDVFLPFTLQDMTHEITHDSTRASESPQSSKHD